MPSVSEVAENVENAVSADSVHRHGTSETATITETGMKTETPRKAAEIESKPKGISALLGGGFGDLLGGLTEKLANLETEDILILMILYLMYRESEDSEMLIIMAAMLLL